MTSSTILDLTRQALMLVLLLSLPIVLIASSSRSCRPSRRGRTPISASRCG
jgi:hypothetical protein